MARPSPLFAVWWELIYFPKIAYFKNTVGSLILKDKFGRTLDIFRCIQGVRT
jgi:hypothetical protein